MGRNFDSLLKELIEEKYENIVCPPKEEMWRQLEERLSQGKKQKIFMLSYVSSRIKTILKAMPNYLTDKLSFFTIGFTRNSEGSINKK